MNKISKMKVHWQTYNHCLFVSYLASIAFRYGWISDANFRNSRIRIGYEDANSFRIWIRSWKINIRSHLLSKSRHSPKVFSNAKSKSKWSLKNLKNATFPQKLLHFFSITSVQIRWGSKILKWFTVRIQFKFNKLLISDVVETVTSETRPRLVSNFVTETQTLP